MADPRFARHQLEDQLSPLASKLGISCAGVSPDRAVYEMPFRQDNTTIGTIVHGGAILSLADCAATAAAWSTVEDPNQYRGLTIGLSLSFMSAARGTDLVATAEVTRRGGTVCFCSVTIATKDGALVASAQVTYKLSRILTPAETMTNLFSNKCIEEQAEILAALELGGAALYRSFAEHMDDPADRQKLLDNATRENENAEILGQMRWPKSKP